MDFVKNGYSIYLDKDPLESYDMFYKRGWFIVSQINNDNISPQSYNKIISYSKIWINMKYNRCSYGSSIEKEIATMTKNMLVW